MVRSVVSNSAASSPMLQVRSVTVGFYALRLRKRKGMLVGVTNPFSLSAEHEDFRAVVADFAARDLAPHVERWNAAHEAPLEAIKLMGDLGLFGLGGPEEYGGAGDFTSLCIAIEEIGRVDQSLGITLEAAVGLGINPIAHFGTAEQKQRWLPDLLAGHALAAFGLTEAEAGSDAGATRTRAELRDGQWVINGDKQFITNSGTDITSLCTVTARTGTREDGKPEISTICVPAGTPGLEVGPAYAKLGWHASDTHPLDLHRRAGARGPPARRAWPRLPAVPLHPRRRPGGHRRAGARLHPRLPGPRPSRTRWSADRSAGRSVVSRGWPSRSPTWT